MSRHVVLIACCGKKLDHAAPARDLYCSPLFKKSVAYAERRGLEWAVLSASHGVVLPTDVIKPYDVTLNSASINDLGVWSEMVIEQLEEKFPGAIFTVIAGRRYRVPLAGFPHTVPFEGMGIGEQLGFLTRDAAEHAAAEQAREDRAQAARAEEAVPVCAVCLGGCHAGGEPDFAYRLAAPGETCGAADHEDPEHEAVEDAGRSA